MKITLNKLKIGESGVIVNVHGEGAVRRRLFDMGLTPGAHVYLRKKAPLGDPVEITLRNYELTLRKEEASNVDILLDDENAFGEKEKKL